MYVATTTCITNCIEVYTNQKIGYFNNFIFAMYVLLCIEGLKGV